MVVKKLILSLQGLFFKDLEV